MSDKDKSRGLYNKFIVKRADGSSEHGDGKHYGCDYFVLDLTHDPLAIEAIRAYAIEASKAGYNKLAEDLWQKAKDLQLMLDNKQAKGPIGLCFYCKHRRSLPALQPIYTNMPETPIIQVRICADCRKDLEQCVKEINDGMSPKLASTRLEERIDLRAKG